MEDGSHAMTVEQDNHLHAQNPPSPSPPRPPKARGGWRAIKYILGNESFEKLASMSLIVNLIVYLKTKYNMEGVFLMNVMTIWSGTSNVASLAGAFISDAYLGRFLTLLFGSIASFLGMGAFTLTASIPELRPACHGELDCSEAHGWQLGVLFIGLGLLAIGAGGVRPCNIAFGADQFDLTTEKGRSQLESFFNWWYFSFTVALLIALTAVVYIQTNMSWVIGYAIPTACLAISITIFWIGRRTYIYIKPQGSIFLDIAKVIVASYHKRGCQIPTNPLSLYDPPKDEMKPLARTDVFKCLDKAALIVDDELDNQGKAKNTWRLCSVQQVEQLKCLVGVLPVSISGIGCFLVMDQMSNFGVLQAIQMNRFFGRKFEMPPAWIGLTSMIALSLWILMYEKCFLPSARKCVYKDTDKDPRLTLKQRIKIGIVMSILCMVVAGFVERKRREVALSNGGSFTSPLPVITLLPQFVLSGLTEAFAAIAVMEFLSTQLPESLRTVAGAIFFFSLSIASYMSTVLVNTIHWFTRKSPLPWLGGHDLNKNRLDYYFYVIAAFGVLNFLYFTFFASKYILNSTNKNGSSGGSRSGDGGDEVVEQRQFESKNNDKNVIRSNNQPMMG